MVTAGELYVLAGTVMALVALAAAIPVLRDIAVDGRERWRAGGPEPPAEAGSSGDESEGVRCRHCGVENEPGYAYCQGCSRQL